MLSPRSVFCFSLLMLINTFGIGHPKAGQGAIKEVPEPFSLVSNFSGENNTAKLYKHKNQIILFTKGCIPKSANGGYRAKVLLIKDGNSLEARGSEISHKSKRIGKKVCFEKITKFHINYEKFRSIRMKVKYAWISSPYKNVDKSRVYVNRYVKKNGIPTVIDFKVK